MNHRISAALNELSKISARLDLGARNAELAYECFSKTEDLGRADEKRQLAARVKAAAVELETLLESAGLVNN